MKRGRVNLFFFFLIRGRRSKGRDNPLLGNDVERVGGSGREGSGGTGGRERSGTVEEGYQWHHNHSLVSCLWVRRWSKLRVAVEYYSSVLTCLLN